MLLRLSARPASAAILACRASLAPAAAAAALLRRPFSQVAGKIGSARAPNRTPRTTPTLPRAAPFAVARAAYSSSSSSPAPTADDGASSAAPAKPDYLNEAETVIWDRLVAEFAPAELVVQDISGGCGSMYGIEISSDRFRGHGMLKQQRMVNGVLADLMKGWHGVQLRTRVP
ncbi:hypothetical protein RB595_006910 [Gaeumannomyces hyphopodioides]